MKPLAIALLLWSSVSGAQDNRCGKNVDRGLLGILNALYANFKTWTPEEKAAACEGLYGKNAGTFWDIVQLRQELTKPAAERVCENTVEVTVRGARQCFHGWAVNYVSFGVMNQICVSYSLGYLHYGAKMVAGTTYWKMREYGGDGLLASLMWAGAGFHYGVPINFYNVIAEPALQRRCPVTAVPEENFDRFKAKWGEHSIREDK